VGPENCGKQRSGRTAALPWNKGRIAGLTEQRAPGKRRPRKRVEGNIVQSWGVGSGNRVRGALRLEGAAPSAPRCGHVKNHGCNGAFGRLK